MTAAPSLFDVTPALRLTYDVGSERSPVDPFGRTLLVLTGTGSAELTVRSARRSPGAWQGHLDLSVLARVLGALHRAGFPSTVSSQVFVPDATIGRIQLEQGEIQAHVSLDRYRAEKMPGYGEAYAVLDALAFLLSGGTTAPPRPDLPLPQAITHVKPLI
ncbi:hypothetical protein [Chondromyces apiculatus]|uniref:Uncharacterized protein n=1 Tax=Chondromyces apiculatus DSM 436 TaxID=1192034 RepID=A0A017TFW9_9BACT|nr:hypothetical protein [Chondromyces apiculatus]EYF08114.1 Hypothetical protein CAP_5874 [Chondromyces apiculatus DSM 436]